MSRYRLRCLCGCLALVALLWPIASIAAGSQPGLWVTPLELDFGEVGVGTTSAQQVVTITNTGSATLTNFAGGAPFDSQFGAFQNCAGGVAPGASCQYTFYFQPTATGVFSTTSNTSTNAGPFVIKLYGQSGTVPADATLSFSSNPVAPGGVSRMTIALSNRNRTAVLDDVALDMTLPPGVRIAATPEASVSACGEATVAAVAGANTLELAGAQVGRGEPCLVGVNVTAPGAGAYTISTGAISSSNGGAGSGASAVLRVAVPEFKLFLPLVRR